MIPPEFAEVLKGLSLYELAVVIGVGILAVWAVWKFGSWVVKKFFPGLVLAARGILAGAKIYGAVQDLPDFTERVDHTLAVLEANQIAQGQKIDQIHHETHFNNGSSTKDGVIRGENRLKRIEKHLGIEEDEEAVKPTPVAH